MGNGDAFPGEDDQRKRSGRRASDAPSELIVYQLGELSKGQEAIKAAVENVRSDLQARIIDLERTLGRRVTDLELWKAEQVAAQKVRDALEASKTSDRGAQLVKAVVLALTCLAVVLYLLAQHLP